MRKTSDDFVPSIQQYGVKLDKDIKVDKFLSIVSDLTEIDENEILVAEMVSSNLIKYLI